ncbi:MAG TPA: hypothetical protein PKD64_19330 [Pirellulaceae bacterium]|nr:hypothetical protein [Pirellulaceae bacterium]
MYAQSDQPLSVAECISAIERFEKAFEGKTVFLEQRTPEAEAKGIDSAYLRAISTSPGHKYISYQTAGRQLGEYTAKSGETVVSQGRFLFASLDSNVDRFLDMDQKVDGKHIHSLWGRMGLSGFPIKSTMGSWISIWIGLSQYDGDLLSRLLRHPSASSSVRMIVNHDGFTGTELESSIVGRGIYRIWIEGPPTLRVRRVEIIKRIGDAISDPLEPDNEVPLGNFPTEEDGVNANNKDLEHTIKHKNADREKAQDQVPETRVHTIHWPFEYDASDPDAVAPILIRTQDFNARWQKEPTVYETRRLKVEPFSYRDTGKLVFQRINVPENSKVRVVDQPGLGYEYRNGDIVRDIDVITIEQLGEKELPIRIRKQNWPITTWTGLVFAILFVFAVAIMIVRYVRSK